MILSFFVVVNLMNLSVECYKTRLKHKYKYNSYEDEFDCIFIYVKTKKLTQLIDMYILLIIMNNDLNYKQHIMKISSSTIINNTITVTIFITNDPFFHSKTIAIMFSSICKRESGTHCK